MSYTPEEITEILEAYFDSIAHRQYVGSRYVPIFGRVGESSCDWDNTGDYEPLTIVLYQGNSYTSRQFVPAGADISNTDYWVLTGNFNAQVEQYRVRLVAVENALPIADFGSEDTVKDSLDALDTRVDSIEDALPAASYDSSNTVEAAIDRKGAKFITLDELPTANKGVYTLGRVEVASPIAMSTVENRDVIIVDSVFDIQTPNMFSYTGSSYFIMPEFVGCTFKNDAGADVCVVEGGTNNVFTKFTGCNFIDVDLVHGADYVQDLALVNCVVQSHDVFVSTTSAGTAQIRMMNCSVEQNSSKIASTRSLVGMFSGTYEGNIAENFYFIECESGAIEFNSCWFESTKMLHLSGASVENRRTTLSFVGCQAMGQTATYQDQPILKVDNGQYVNLYIVASRYTPNYAGSRFTNLKPSEFEQIVGEFEHGSSDSYNYPIGGESNLGNRIASQGYADSLVSSKFQYGAQNVSSGTDLEITLPTGAYILTLGRGTDNCYKNYRQMIVTAALGTSSTESAKHELTNSNDTTYLQALTVTPAKAAATDTTFTVTVSSTQSFRCLWSAVRIR